MENAFKDYVKMLNKPKLTKEEEFALSIKMSLGDKRARSEFIERNLRLVVSIAPRYVSCGMPIMDIIQEGNIGLIKAVDKYDITLGYRFSTYAVRWIQRTIEIAIKNKGRNIRLPIHIHRKLIDYQKAKFKLEKKLNKRLSLEEISKKLNMKYEEVKELELLLEDTISLNSLLYDTENVELENVLGDSNNPEEIFTCNNLSQEIYELMQKCKLDDRQIDILNKRFGLNGNVEMTLEVLAEIYHLSIETIRQIQIKALNKIRQSKYIKDFVVYGDFLNIDNTAKVLKKAKKTK